MIEHITNVVARLQASFPSKCHNSSTLDSFACLGMSQGQMPHMTSLELWKCPPMAYVRSDSVFLGADIT